jgi:hypothetical protein
MSPRFEEVAVTYGRSRLNFGGAGRIRTGAPLLAKQVLYQLSYDPEIGRLCCEKELWFSIFTLCDQLEPRRQQVLPLTASFDHQSTQPKLNASSP